MRSGMRVSLARDVSLPESERALKESRKFCARSFALSFMLVITMSDFSSPGYLLLREIKLH
jgi:hypothetical protein